MVVSLQDYFSNFVFLSPRLRQASGSSAARVVGSKAERGAIVAPVCPAVRLSADLSSHLPLEQANKGRAEERRSRPIQPRVQEAVKETQLLEETGESS